MLLLILTLDLIWSSLIKIYTLPRALENNNLLNKKQQLGAFAHVANQNCAFILFVNILEEFPKLGFAKDNQDLCLHNRKSKH